MSQMNLRHDLWSSTNNLSLLGIFAHFQDALYRHHALLLALPQVWEAHDGANQAETILNVTSTYGITAQIEPLP